MTRVRSFLTRVLFVVLDSHRYTLCCECVNDEFIYITPLSVFGTVFVGTGALVSNTPPQAGRVLRTTQVLYRSSAFAGGSMHPCAHDTGKTHFGKKVYHET